MEKHSEDEYITLLGKTKKELANMSDEDRSNYIEKRIKDIESQIEYTMLLKNDETAYDFISVTDILFINSLITGGCETLYPDSDIDTLYLKRIVDALYFSIKPDSNIILPYPTINAIVKKVTGNDLDFETYMIIENKNDFDFVEMNLSDRIRIKKTPISEEKAKEFYNKSSRNKDRTILIDLFGKDKTKEY